MVMSNPETEGGFEVRLTFDIAAIMGGLSISEFGNGFAAKAIGSAIMIAAEFDIYRRGRQEEQELDNRGKV